MKLWEESVLVSVSVAVMKHSKWVYLTYASTLLFIATGKSKQELRGQDPRGRS